MITVRGGTSIMAKKAPRSVQTAFQMNAFQNDSFQIVIIPVGGFVANPRTDVSVADLRTDFSTAIAREQ
jgi:hypothetical protein